MISKATLSSKIAVIGLVILLFFFADIKYKQWKNQQSIEKEKQNLTQESADLNKKNQDLSDSLTYLTSDLYKEHIAREQLNLKKEGETVYNFSQAQTISSTPQTLLPNQSNSNIEKWWFYFFSKN